MTGIDLVVAGVLLVLAVAAEGWGLWRLTGPLDDADRALSQDKGDS